MSLPTGTACAKIGLAPPAAAARVTEWPWSTFSIAWRHRRGAQIDYRGSLNDEQYAAVTAKPGPILVHRRRGQRQDAHAHLPRRLPDRERRRAGEHPAAHLHQQIRARDAGAGRQRCCRTTSRASGAARSTPSRTSCCAVMPTGSGSPAASPSWIATTRPTWPWPRCAPPAATEGQDAAQGRRAARHLRPRGQYGKIARQRGRLALPVLQSRSSTRSKRHSASSATASRPTT